jgi:hypothetical protein
VDKLEELKDVKLSIVIKPKESIVSSIIKDIVTFIVVGLLVYVSRDSSWWTLVTGLMFILFAWGKLASHCKNNVHVFGGKEDAIKFLQEKR